MTERARDPQDQPAPSGDPRPIAVATRRGPVECAIVGEGPAVLALHGAMGGHDQSLLLARTLGAPGFRYVCLSRPGYLGTDLARGRTPREQADLYRDVLDALGVDRAAVLAVSGGGPSALQFAASHRDRCWGAVIVSSVCSRNHVRLPLAWYLMKLTARCGPLVAAMRRKAASDPERAARRSIPDPALRARTLADLEAGPLLHALQLSTLDRMRLRLPGTENDVAVTRGALALDLERIAVPVLVVHGTGDRVAPFAQGQAMASRIPAAELLALEGGDHVAIFTHREQARARVAEFLRAHAPAAAGAGTRSGS
jgi:pimeloyl-ACP methyl ester carboxylesterase